MRARGMVSLCLVAMLLLAGCVSLKREPPLKHQFVLEVQRDAPADLFPPETILYLRPAAVGHIYDAKGFVYRKKNGTYESDFYNEFFSAPAELFSEEIRQWFSGSGLSHRIVGSIDREMATHALDTRVNELYADYAEDDTPHAVLEMEFVFYRLDEDGSDALYEQKFRREVPLADDKAAALVNAWNGAFQEILTELSRDLRNAGR